MKPIVEVLPDPAAVIATAARRFRAAAAEAIAARGRFAVALSGGRTPNALYAALARPPRPGIAPGVGPEIDWPHVHLFWGDERCVPPDASDSNFGTATKALEGAPIPRENLHRMPADMEPPQAGALAYERILRDFFGLGPDGVPVFDLALLGLGADGHTASLFPGASALDQQRRLVMADWICTLAAYRVTLTYPVFNAARQVLFLATGGDKAAIVRRVVAERDTHLPAARVAPSGGELRFLLDRDAASALPA